MIEKGFFRGSLKRLTELILAAFGIHTSVDLIRLIVEWLKKIHTTDPRADLLYVILLLDEVDAAQLWKHHRKAMDEGLENDFVQNLAKALDAIRKGDGSFNEDLAKRIYTLLAQMDEPTFNQALEELRNDAIVQKLKHWLKHGKNFADLVAGILACGAGIAVGMNDSLTKEVKRWGRTRKPQRKLSWWQKLHA